MVDFVVLEMTSLAPRPQVLRIAVLGYVVEMPDRQYDDRAGHWVWLPIFCSAVGVSRRALAPMPGPRQDRRPDLRLPVVRVAIAVFGSDRHCSMHLAGPVDNVLPGDNYGLSRSGQRLVEIDEMLADCHCKPVARIVIPRQVGLAVDRQSL